MYGSRLGALNRPAAINESASAFSDVGSEDGRHGYAGGRASSSKAQLLANEIATIEERCDFLEQRNKWLTDKLLRNQRKFIERTMLQSTKTVARHCFRAWHDVMDLLRLEQQLHQQTESLDKCQHVAKDLGQGLAREQVARRKTEEACQQLEAELDQMAQTNATLDSTIRKQDLQIKALNRQLATALDGLGHTKNDCQAMYDSIEQMEARCREMKKEDAELLADIKVEPVMNRAPLGGNSGHAIEESVLKRDEATLVMQSVSSLLHQSHANDHLYDPRISMSSVGDKSGARFAARTSSPLEERFQAMSHIAAHLEHGSSATSPLIHHREIHGQREEVKPSPLSHSRDLLGQSDRADRASFFGRSSASSILRR